MEVQEGKVWTSSAATEQMADELWRARRCSHSDSDTGGGIQASYQQWPPGMTVAVSRLMCHTALYTFRSTSALAADATDTRLGPVAPVSCCHRLRPGRDRQCGIVAAWPLAPADSPASLRKPAVSVPTPYVSIHWLCIYP